VEAWFADVLGAIVPHNFSVLIVEDDDDARRNMEDVLSLDGYSIQSVSHCLPAIVAVESNPFDAVIVDWRLPDRNADELIPIINEHQPGTPVVVVTGMRDFDTCVAALRSGVYDFLPKPINPDVFRGVLARILERKKHISEIKAGHEKLLVNERLAAIGQMVAGVAHESRNAFQRSHACLAELTLDLQDKPASLDLVHKVQKSLDDLNFLLEEVRNYSAPIVLERRTCCLQTIVQDTWQRIIKTHNSKPPDFELRIEDSFPEDCFCDPDRIQQVIRNLLENAHYASGESGRVSVSLGLTEQSSVSMLSIKVSDTGDGIDSAQKEQIFAPFHTTKTKGTGLGLAVSRRFVEAHDGRIFADETKNGACLVAELPNRRPTSRSPS